MSVTLGKTLLIANPVSQSGKGAEAAQEAELLLRKDAGTALEVVLTEAPKHAVELARAAAGYDTVVALGGDGVIHETANGLMQIAQPDRPRMGILPIGSGNDFARSLDISRSNIPASVGELLTGVEQTIDVGCCNGEYFVETLSFGLDAAIAIETMELRKTTDKTETALYLKAGMDQLLHHLDAYRFDVVLDGARHLTGQSIVFAVQNGVTYGGGFRICPDAQLDDGQLDLCYTNGLASLPKCVYIFLRAKDGKHGKYDVVNFDRASSIDLKFDRRPPCQMDGEIHLADEYRITLEKAALRVIRRS